MTPKSEKVVTIRGLNELYYNQFLSLTKIMGKSVGIALSELLTHYKKPMPPVLGSTKMRHLFLDSFFKKSAKLEIIENQSKLVLARELFLEMGQKTLFLFNNIKELILDESIDDEVILNYIYRIRNSNVKTKGNISQLLLYSLIRSTQETEEQKLKEITIRKVNSSVYDDFIASCRLHNQSIGEAVNELFSQFIPEAEIMFIVIQQFNSNFNDLLVITGLEEVVVTEHELQSIKDRKLLLHRIKNLIFDKSVSKESFQDQIAGIFNCKKVNLPPNIPKLLELSRIKNFP